MILIKFKDLTVGQQIYQEGDFDPWTVTRFNQVMGGVIIKRTVPHLRVKMVTEQEFNRGSFYKDIEE